MFHNKTLMALAMLVLLASGSTTQTRDGSSCRLTASSGKTTTKCKDYVKGTLSTCKDSSKDPTTIDCATLTDSELTNPASTTKADKTALKTKTDDLMTWAKDTAKDHVKYANTELAKAQLSNANVRIDAVKVKLEQFEKDLVTANEEYAKAKKDYMPAENQYVVCAINWGWIFKYFCSYYEIDDPLFDEVPAA